jgi:hypothetical protein
MNCQECGHTCPEATVGYLLHARSAWISERKKSVPDIATLDGWTIGTDGLLWCQDCIRKPQMDDSDRRLSRGATEPKQPRFSMPSTSLGTDIHVTINGDLTSICFWDSSHMIHIPHSRLGIEFAEKLKEACETFLEQQRARDTAELLGVPR